MPGPIDARLARIRGAVQPWTHTARTLAALTRNPGCGRRAVVDAAGVDKLGLAKHVGFPARFGQSPFAIARGNAFEAQVKENDCAGLIDLLRPALGLDLEDVGCRNLELASRDEPVARRLDRSLRALRHCLSDPRPMVFDHPLLGLDVAGARCHLEPDLLLFGPDGFHLVEIKSFAVIDGQADGAKVAAAAIQAAAYLLALRQSLSQAAADLIRPEVILVCPENFSNRPNATVIDIRKQLLVLEHQLGRLARVESLLAELPAHLTLDPMVDATGNAARPVPELAAALSQLSARYRPECLEYCELAMFCRNEACGTTAALGANIREALGGVDTIAEVLALASGEREPGRDQAEIAALLRGAAALYQEGLASAPSRPAEVTA